MTKQVEKEEAKGLHRVALLIALVLPTIVTLVYFHWLADHQPAVQQLAYSIGKTIQFALPVVWVMLFFRHRFARADRAASKPTEGSRRELPHWPGWLLAIGFGCFVCIVMGGAYWLLSGGELIAGMTQQVQIKVSSLGINSAGKFAILGLFYALVHSFLEEYYWRWFVYDMLKRFVRIPTANMISSLGFMAHHVVLLSVYFGWTSPMTWLCSAGVAIGGAFWAWLYEKSGSLYWPWLSHMIVDAGIFALGYFLVRGTFAP